jgi:serine/threonine-protein kinase
VAQVGGECDVAKVLDFGLVKITHGPDAGELTTDQRVSGTPAFMPPEQSTGQKDLDPRADIYALGAIAYYGLTGRPPFTADNAIALMIAHAKDPVTPPSAHRPDVPKDLEHVILKCLEKSPHDRFANVKELAKALAACESASEWNEEKAEAWWRANPITISA